MRVVQHLDEDQWKAFVDQHPEGNIFHTPEMFRVFARTKGYEPDLWAAVDDRSDVLALIAPVHIALMNGALRRLTTRSVAYGSVLYQDTPDGQAALQLLLNTYARSIRGQSLFSELRNLHSLDHLRPLLTGCGYVYNGHLNYLIDLNRPAEAVLQSIGPRTRKKIRKGLRAGQVSVCEVSDRSDLAAWYEMLQKTYNNARVPLADRSLFDAVFDVLRPAGMAKFLMARTQGVVVACSIELPYKDTIYGWYGGCDRAYREYAPNELLIWHILEWGASNGYRVYDFGGAGQPGEEYGVRDFKAKFGGQLVNFGRYTLTHSPHVLKLSQLGYAVYRRLRRAQATG